VGDGGVNRVGGGVNVGDGAKVALSGSVCGAKHALKLINGVIKSAVMNIRISLRISNLHFPVPPPLTLRRAFPGRPAAPDARGLSEMNRSRERLAGSCDPQWEREKLIL
jgi:hypothetical protein